jgi:hypothetical protein
MAETAVYLDDITDPSPLLDAAAFEAAFACPAWCELPDDHDTEESAGSRWHRAAIFRLDDRVMVSVVQLIELDAEPLERLASAVRAPEIDIMTKLGVVLSRDEALEVYAAWERAADKLREIHGAAAPHSHLIKG